jgi:hypothetical protein
MLFFLRSGGWALVKGVTKKKNPPERRATKYETMATAIRDRLQELHKSFLCYEASGAGARSHQKIYRSMLDSFEAEYRAKESELLVLLEDDPGATAELEARRAAATLSLSCRPVVVAPAPVLAAHVDCRPKLPWSACPHEPKITSADVPSWFLKTFSAAITALRYPDGSYKSVRKHKNRVHQAQVSFSGQLRRVGNVEHATVGAALVVAAMLDKRLRLTTSSHRWWRWIGAEENFVVWKREMDAQHKRPCEDVAKHMAAKHRADARGRPCKN